MRLIGELDNDQEAKRLAAFLLVRGIESQVDLVDGSKAEIWVKDEDRFKEAHDELNNFLANPTDAKYSEAVRKAKVIFRAEEKKRQQIQKKIVHVGAGQLQRRRPLTFILIGACILVALATNFGEGVPTDHPVYQALQFVAVGPPDGVKLAILAQEIGYDNLQIRLASISRGEIWRAVTQIFIHYGIFHIVFNLIWFFQFGTVIEHRYGTLKFGLLILATAAISNVVAGIVPMAVGGRPPFLLSSNVFITNSGGMSGVVYGLFGFIWMKSTYDRSFGYRLSQSTVIILIGWLFFCMIPIEMREKIGFGIAVGNWAHAIGLLVGMAIGYWTSISKSQRAAR